VGGFERIGDTDQLVAPVVQSELSLANLESVDELVETGVGEATACELVSQFPCRTVRRSGAA
jgi:hypothetical protein